MKTLLPKVFALFILVFLTSKYLARPIFSDLNPHIVINEIQTAGNSANDEFVELYNQSANPLTMTNWKLTHKISNGAQSNLVSTLNGTIPAYGYFLIAHPIGYSSNTIKNIGYSSSSYSVTSDNTVILYDQSNLVIDKVGMGTPFESEASPAPQPPANSSIERISHRDTNNNALDFIINNSPNPQNSLSPVDPPSVSPSPTIQPSLDPTPSPSFEPSTEPSPSVSPTIIPSASPSIVPSPTPIISPSPTIVPSSSPLIESSATPNPTVNPSPSISPTPIPSDRILFNKFNIICKLQYSAKQIARFIFYIPKLTCTSGQ